jgi:predicted Ser/Thr protein kinase
VNPSRWREVNDVFHAARELSPQARDAYLRETATRDPELAREVETLLNADTRSGGFLESPAWTVSPELLVDPEPNLQGQRIGKYRVIEEIGRGGMGVVYVAEDELLGRTVALKALPPEYAKDPARRERLAREARLTAQLQDHDAIATVYGLEEHEGELYIASELVKGHTLREELANGPLPPDRLLPTLTGIAEALAAAHAHHIVHRDLKPENVKRRPNGRIKVLDFGLARIINSPDAVSTTRITQEGLVAGTPGYLAPEQLSGREADARSDLFVFGLLAWELATGRHPLGATSRSQLARLLDLTEGRELPLNGPLPVPGLDAIIRRCVRRLPDDRYQSADVLVEDLRRLGVDDAVGASARTAPHALWWWRFHQIAMAVLDGSTPALAWFVRHWIPSGATRALFLAVLAAATVGVTLRLNLVFTAQINPAMLIEHRRRLVRWIATAELSQSAGLLAGAFLLAGDHDTMTAVLLTLAIVTVASLAIIEPTTTSAAGLSRPSSQ